MAGTKRRKDRLNHNSHNNNHVHKTTSKHRHHDSLNDHQHKHTNTPKSNNDDDNNSSNPSSDCCNDNMFPQWTPQIVWLVCTLLRVSYVTQPDNWWVLHPDENFQSLEVAHTQVYGFGFRPYEFSSLSHGSTGGASNESVSFYRQRELQLGMHGMRSALYPSFYVIVSWVAAILSLDVKPFVLWKVAHAVVSSLLPLSVYRFSRTYFSCHDASCLAAILAVTSTHLNVLGTHPLLNSFLAPAVFWALSCILPLVCGHRSPSFLASSEEAKDSDHHGSNGIVYGQSQTKPHVNGLNTLGTASQSFDGKVCGKNGTRPLLNGVKAQSLHRKVCEQTETKPPVNGVKAQSLHGKVCEQTETKPTVNGVKTSQTESESYPGCNGELFHPRPNADTSSSALRENGHIPHPNGTIPGGFDKVSDKLEKDFHFAHSDRNGVTTCSNGNAKLSLVSQLKPQELFESKVLLSFRATLLNFLSGFVLALCVYMRVDVALFTAVTLLPKFRSGRAQFGSLIVCSLGAVLGISCGVLQDFWFYDELVLSPQNWARFNVFRDLSGDLFGKSFFFRYFELLFSNTLGLSVLVACSVIIVLFSVVVQVKSYICQLWACNRNDKFRSQNENNSSTIDYSHHINQSDSNENQDPNLNHWNSDVPNRDNNNNCNNSNKNNNHHDNNTLKSDFISNTTSNKLEVSQKVDETSVVNRSDSLKTNMSEYNPATTLTLSWAALLLFYSSKEHKELRFVHNTTVLMLISSAFVISTTLNILSRKFDCRQGQLLTVIVLTLFAADQWSSFPSSKDQSNKPWAYQRIEDSHDVNACLDYVSAQNDVTGVFLDSNFHATAGYALLHKDVPVFTLLVHEFVEFDDVTSKMRVSKPSLLDGFKNVSYVTVDKLSNFVSVQNAGYLVKVLIQKQQYNYFIIAKERKFLEVGFTDVFAHGTMRVVRRTFEPLEERQLVTMASRAPIGVNATVLKYEGDVLFRFHRFPLALERYTAAVQLNPGIAQIYQAIAACKRKLDDEPEARKWIETCVKRFGVKECSLPLSITNINPDRTMF
ncbi:uncharacterized protein [Littorina saxatilis]|uniref:Mannosyltransferase n=1 Tax=Littorina saxatilis TaxID=31220 RepID=A0AAN9FXZ8_9CAEN